MSLDPAVEKLDQIDQLHHEMIVADELLEDARGKALIGDSGYDSNQFGQAGRERKMKPVIGAKPEQ